MAISHTAGVRVLAAFSGAALAAEIGEEVALLSVQQRYEDRQVLDAQAPRVLKGMCKGQKEQANQDPMRTRELKLIHIPRTGGTTMEDCSKVEEDREQRWGQHLALDVKKGKDGVFKCSAWHVPPALMSHDGSQKCHSLDGAKQYKPYSKNEDTFCVVRDPYERLISEYGFYDKLWLWDRDGSGCTKENINAGLLKKMMAGEGRDHYDKTKNMNDDCHYLPQAAYVYSWDTENNKVDTSRSCCTHVLRFNSLAEDFNQLMEKYSYPYRMENQSASDHTQSLEKCQEFKPSDMTDEVVRLTEEFFRADFELLKFQRISEQRLLDN